ncbi:hypothetical protein TcWFU_005773 [Taenia crassiceps]|uniref:Uncharacterized protein n=1 Tax=Taenia crassiceps TaxID=6207 RepID=A0ABR4Q9F7_9CEST
MRLASNRPDATIEGMLLATCATVLHKNAGFLDLLLISTKKHLPSGPMSARCGVMRCDAAQLNRSKRQSSWAMASTTSMTMTIVTTTTTASKSKLRFSGGALKSKQCRSHYSGHTHACEQRQAHTGATSSLTHSLSPSHPHSLSVHRWSSFDAVRL